MERVALVTGASSGIGRELARVHAARGGDCVLVARREAALEELATELQRDHGRASRVLAMDLTDPAAPDRLYGQLAAEGIEVEFLVNNAGFGGQGAFVERSAADDLAMVQLNVVALTALTKLFLPGMVERGHGRVLQVASTAGLVPGGPLQAVYYATKAYVVSLSRGLAGELAGGPVTVTALCPGVTETEFGKRSGMDGTDLFDDAASAREVAEAGYEAMLAGDRICMAGVSLPARLLVGAMPLLPEGLVLEQIRKAQAKD